MFAIPGKFRKTQRSWEGRMDKGETRRLGHHLKPPPSFVFATRCTSLAAAVEPASRRHGTTSKRRAAAGRTGATDRG